MEKKPNRLLSLDIMRGITIAGMILVNNAGSWGHIYRPLSHAEWNGLTPTDLVFPFFMFIMGVSTYLSLRRWDFKPCREAIIKIVRRTIVIFAIGLFVAWFALWLRGIRNGDAVLDAACNFSEIRILGVFPRLAICYGVGALIAIFVKHRRLPWVIFGMLAVYAVILLTGNGYSYSTDNIISIVDHAVLGPSHMYTSHFDGESFKFDPEGLLSTLPSIAHMLIGLWCGMKMMQTRDNYRRALQFLLVGGVLTMAGFLLSYGMPINKKIWSPTFVLTTCGLAATLLGLLIWIIDIKGYRRWTPFFHAFGVNALATYLFATILSIIIGFIRVPYSATESGVITLKGWVVKAVMEPVAGGDLTLASCLFAIFFVLVNWIFAYILYTKKIFIKI